MIRNYIETDKPELLRIFELNIPKYFAPKEAILFDDYLEKHGDSYLVIEHKNVIAGSVGYEWMEHETTGVITWIFIHPDHHRQGYGKKAVEHCLQILKENTLTQKIIVRTSQLANKFFESFGFKLVYSEKDYWAEGFDLYQMEMKIKHD